jgi:hypothetical protein
MTSVTLASSSGSVENLNVSTRQGWTPYAFHARATVAWSTPNRGASSRLDQCVTPSFFGGGRNVASTIFRSSTVFGRPDRSASDRAGNPARA